MTIIDTIKKWFDFQINITREQQDILMKYGMTRYYQGQVDALCISRHYVLERLRRINSFEGYEYLDKIIEETKPPKLNINIEVQGLERMRSLIRMDDIVRRHFNKVMKELFL